MSRTVLPYGEQAVLVECADLTEMRALRSWLEQARKAAETGADAVLEVIPGARTLLLRIERPLEPAFLRGLTTAALPAPEEIDSELIRIPVSYDGADLAEVAETLGCSVDQVIERHTGRRWSVAFCGFAPGFAYLAPQDANEDGDDPERSLQVPRRSSPRTRVLPGSVGLADRWSGVYPRAAPGGWQLIGRTERRVWDLAQDPPALLQPGMQVQFELAEPDAPVAETADEP